MFIEINLAPGAASRRNRRFRVPALSLPSWPSLTVGVRVIVGAIVGTLSIAVLGFGYWRVGERRVEIEAWIEQELADSTHFAATIALLAEVDAKRDTIEHRISLIRGVDSRRYVWPHLLDEISLAVPAFTWITAINSVEDRGLSLLIEDPAAIATPRFTIQGNAGSTHALTRFMKNLEASPFVRDVMLVTAEQDQIEGRAIQWFSLEASYRSPDPSFIQTYPLTTFD